MTISAIQHVTYIAPAISCGHCVRKVHNALHAIAGVSEVHASAETRFVDVDFDPTVVSTDVIEQTLASAGFPVQK